MSSRVCETCGADAPAASRICPNCGAGGWPCGAACSMLAIFCAGLALAALGGFATCVQAVSEQRPQGVYVGLIVVGLGMVVGTVVWWLFKLIRR